MSCAICFEDYNAKNSSTLACNHGFHTACIAGWIEQSPTCPNCRYIIAPLEAWYACRDSVEIPSPPIIHRMHFVDTKPHTSLSEMLWDYVLNILTRSTF
jgi:hypothetical protein